MIVVSTLGGAASLLHHDLTAHFPFKIPVSCLNDHTCSTTLNSEVGQAIGNVDFEILDDIVLCHKHGIEALDKTFRDINQDNSQFGGLNVLLSGDFRQILLVGPWVLRMT